MDPIAWARGPHISDRAAQSPPPHIVPGLETPHRLVEALSFRPISCGNPRLLACLKSAPRYFQRFVLPTYNLRLTPDFSGLFFFLLSESKGSDVWVHTLTCVRAQQQPMGSTPRGKQCPSSSVLLSSLSSPSLWGSVFTLEKFFRARRINHFPPSCCHPLVLPSLSPRGSPGAPVKGRNDSYPSASSSACSLPRAPFPGWGW